MSNLKGNVISATDNSPIRGANIYIHSLDRDVERASDGEIETDGSGNYSIRGFQNMGTVEISIFHDGFQWIEVLKELKKGINIFDFKLNPEQTEKKISDFFFKEMSPSTAAGRATFDGCLCPESAFNTDIDLSCKILNDEKKRCIKFTDTLKGMNERCNNRKMIKIKCDKNCPFDSMDYIKTITWLFPVA